MKCSLLGHQQLQQLFHKTYERRGVSPYYSSLFMRQLIKKNQGLLAQIEYGPCRSESFICFGVNFVMPYDKFYKILPIKLPSFAQFGWGNFTYKAAMKCSSLGHQELFHIAYERRGVQFYYSSLFIRQLIIKNEHLLIQK